jgi:hypothetical protein
MKKHDAIRAVNSNVVTIHGDNAYDANGNLVTYDETAVQAKLLELQTQYAEQQQAQATAKASAIAKLTALGLSAEEISAIGA